MQVFKTIKNKSGVNTLYTNALLQVCILFLCANVFVSCSSLTKSMHLTKPQSIELKNEILIEHSSVKANVEKQKFLSISKSKTLENSQPIKDKIEEVEFVSSLTTIEADPQKKIYTYKVETSDKNGTVNLSELAVPEPGEVMDLVLNANAEVLKAGQYPRESMYFVPSVSLPKKAVKIGDTWENEYTWLSASNALPIKLNLTSILKAAYACASQTCLEIEISGQISIPKNIYQNTSFESEILGRMILLSHNASIVWSKVYNRESTQIGNLEVEVQSCLMAKQIESKENYWPWADDADWECDPEKNKVPKIPGLL